MRTKKYRGGNGSGPSAWSYVYNTVGDGLTQFRNALTIQPGDTIGTIHNNDIEPKSNLNLQSTQGAPTKNDLSLIQKAGKRKRKGGNLGMALMAKHIAKQSFAPITLLALQQSYARTMKKGSKKSRSRRTKRRSRKSRR
jgi:hypothetical protein